MNPTTLLFGATSILGFSLARRFSQTVVPFVTQANRAHSIRQWPVLNLADPDWSGSIFTQYDPDLLLYCHAVCDVPRCEAAPAWAREVNITYLDWVIAALPAKTKLVYVSSDHVFGGDGRYNEESAPCPISIYGKTRVVAEELVANRAGSLIIRVGLPIGPSPNGRTGHWDWLRYRTRRNLPITIVHDEFRSVVWADELASRVMQLAHSSETGIRHVAATRVVSRVELANYLLAIFGEPTTYQRESHLERSAPHIGRVELASIYRGKLYEPLASVLDGHQRYAGHFDQ